MTAGGTLKVSLAFTLTPSFSTFTPGSGTVEYNGAGGQTITSTTYNNLVTSGGGTKTLGGAVTANGNLTIGSATTVSAGSNGITLKGNWTNNNAGGTFSATNSTVNFVSSSSQTLSGSTTFYAMKDVTAGATLYFTAGTTQSWYRTRALIPKAPS